MVETMSRDVAALAGRVIGITAERLTEQQISYFQRRGADVRWAPVLRPIQAEDHAVLAAATAQLLSQPVDLLIVQTGQGLDWWLSGADQRGDTQRLKDALQHVKIICRGANAARVVRRAGFEVGWKAPNESVEDILSYLRSIDLTSHRIAIVLDGSDDRRLADTARTRGATALEIDVSRYRPPLDLQPALALIDAILDHEVDVVTFTTSPAIRHFRRIADEHGTLGQLDHAFRTTCLAAVVDPACSTTAAEAGWLDMVEAPSAQLLPMLDAVTSTIGAAPPA
ncbi:MAG: uroporphyrinogen-III synthase [Acidimicrobiales bacterium]|jgi:uroporphyrinogen-III synthase